MSLPADPDDLDIIYRRLRRRFKVGQGGNILDIGFGRARRKGSKDSRRSWCIVFLVDRKVKHLKDKHGKPIPPEVLIVTGSGRNRKEHWYPTDVVERGPAPIRTGLRVDSSFDAATVGVAVRWKQANDSTMYFGLITVGHFVAGKGEKILITAAQGSTFSGTVIAKTSASIDATLIEVAQSHLKAAGLISQVLTPVRPLTDLIADMNQPGRTLRRKIPMDFQVELFLPRALSLGELSGLKNLLQARANSEAFAKGTSGAAWTILTDLACLQVGGTPPNYSQGFGQAFATVSDWATNVLTKQRNLIPGSFSIVGTF